MMNVGPMIVLVALSTAIVTVYLLPSFIAYRRRHETRGYILLVNLFLGWSGSLWMWCLVWSIMGDGEPSQSHAQPTPVSQKDYPANVIRFPVHRRQ